MNSGSFAMLHASSSPVVIAMKIYENDQSISKANRRVPLPGRPAWVSDEIPDQPTLRARVPETRGLRAI